MQTLLKGTGAYRLLEKDGEKESFSHAYLLLWEDGKNLRDGLKTFAKLFFRCATPTQQARVDDLIDSENFCDCVFFPSVGKKLMVEDAENILEESNLAPVEGDKKLFVLADFSEANTQTQNKLLKLLEEPPKGVYFLLGATSAFSVLQTVLSRTKKLEILPFEEKAVVAFLARKYEGVYDAKALASCAAAAGGKVGDACNLLEGGYYASLIESAFALLLKPLHLLPATVKQVGETPHKKALLHLLRLICRDALLIQMQREDGLSLVAEKAKLNEVANAFSTAALLYAQEALSAAEKQVNFNAIFSQCIQTCVANILAKNKERYD